MRLRQQARFQAEYTVTQVINAGPASTLNITQQATVMSATRVTGTGHTLGGGTVVNATNARFTGAGYTLGGSNDRRRSRLLGENAPGGGGGGEGGVVHDPGHFQVLNVGDISYVLGDLGGTAVDNGRVYTLETLRDESRFHEAVRDYNQEHKVEFIQAVYDAHPWLLG